MSANTIVIVGNARSGTTYLQELLACHKEVDTVGEPLNSEVVSGGDPFEDVDKVLRDADRPVLAFKCFPEQLIDLDVRLNDLLRHLRPNSVVVVWRRNLLEMFVSRKIAQMTNEWYSTSAAREKTPVHIDEDEYIEFADNIKREWSIMGAEWPIEMAPIFVTYEEIRDDGPAIASSILSNSNLDLNGTRFKVEMKRQNPWPLSEKVSNWDQLSDEAKDLRVDVPRIVSEAIFNSIPGSAEHGHLLPHREPKIRAGGWFYRVAEPYVPPEAYRNVVDALNARCISSASHWTAQLARRLRTIFDVPVAQPCANGFTALVLAMQAAGVEPGDEVIVPTFTMIAVPNAVHFVGAVPILVDNAFNQYNPSLKQILEVATEKTKAVIISHTYGVPMQDIVELAATCRERKWTLIEDIAETVGIREQETGKLLGTFGDFACASMYANKIVHAGDGGFIIARDPKCDGRLASLTNHGFTKSFHFLHLEPAINAKMNGLGAALASGVLERLDDIMAHRKMVARHYRHRLDSTPLKQMPACGLGDTPWVFGVHCETKSQRNALRRHLAKNGVETRDYFLPVHLQPCSAKMNGPERRENLKMAASEKLGATGVYLPFQSNLTLDDVDYICDATVSFFDQRHQIREPPRRELRHAVAIKPGEYELEGVEFDASGRPIHRDQRSHTLVKAVMLKTHMEQHLVTEHWDERKEYIDEIEACVKEAATRNVDLSHTFEPLLKYLRITEDFETERAKPWLNVDLASSEFAPFDSIPTTTDEETLQYLPWLIEKSGAKRVLELGCWFGHATGLMGAAVMKNQRRFPDDGRQPSIYALDGFLWQSWMNKFFQDGHYSSNDSFLDRFRQNVESLGDLVRGVKWNVDEINEESAAKNGWFPHDAQFDLIFVDFSEEPEELLKAMTMVRRHCIPGKTIFVFNGFVKHILPFYVEAHREFKPIAYKPRTTCRAFLYVGNEEDQEAPKPNEVEAVQEEATQKEAIHEEATQKENEEMEEIKAFKCHVRDPKNQLRRKLKFMDNPDWDHHHKNAFSAAIDQLREHLHDDRASTLFLPSVGQHLCDSAEDLVGQDWIGIVHQIAHNNCFYYPDLHRMCTSPQYRQVLATCRGLFTLTEYQAQYLRENLPSDLIMPITTLTYPSVLQDVDRSIPKSPANKLAFIGSFARDIDLFYDALVPDNIRKTLVAGDEQLRKWGDRAPSDVEVLDRLDGSEYEQLLSQSVAFLSLKADGAANTLIVECVARGVPILAPRWSWACREYLGEEYPLFYDQFEDERQIDLRPLLTPEKIQSAVQYLSKVDKSKFDVHTFIRDIERSVVMLNVVPAVDQATPGLPNLGARYMFQQFDVTVSVCCYKRTQHLAAQLDRLWNQQKSFKGSMQIIVWNNNDCRQDYVRSICQPYLVRPSETRRLELIQSTQNYYCMIRTCMSSLMQSDRLLICDDDVIPEEDFVQFFYAASKNYPEDVLCARGHKFLEHKLDAKNPGAVWNEYEGLRFVDDQTQTQLVHFAHVDACLIPKDALREWASTPMPDPTFALVDDYWMCYVLNHKFGRNLRKLCTKENKRDVMKRTDDSDKPGLALHTRPEVLDARMRLYVHHMLRGWPSWPSVPRLDEWSKERVEELRESKHKHWRVPFVGYNVSSRLTEKDADDLVRLGVRHVRIGAVGVRKERDFELGGFNTRPQKQMEDLLATIDMLAGRHINVVITMSPRIDLVDAWTRISKSCWHRPNVIGYDLINEPSTDNDKEICWLEITEQSDPEGVKNLIEQYHQLIKIVDEFDPITPVMLEPPFWAHSLALPRLDSMLSGLNAQTRARTIVTFHFYDPPRYNRRTLNQSRYTYPGPIPMYPGEFSPSLEMSRDWIRKCLQSVSKWCTGEKTPFRAVMGEFGVCRDSGGSDEYLRDVLAETLNLSMPVFLFSFRDIEWEAMDYELGTQFNNGMIDSEPSNVLMEVVEKAIADASSKATTSSVK